MDLYGQLQDNLDKAISISHWTEPSFQRGYVIEGDDAVVDALDKADNALKTTKLNNLPSLRVLNPFIGRPVIYIHWSASYI